MSVTASVRRRAALGAAALAAIVLVVTPTGAAAQTITAVAKGADPPPNAPGNQPVVNGDFLINANPPAPITGDGNDEPITWMFDFTPDPNYPVPGPLVSARLTLTVRPGSSGGIVTDLVGITTDGTFTAFIGAGPVTTPAIQSLPVNVTSTVVIELLNYYTSADILATLGANGGRIPMLYHDDVFLSYAKLELVSRPRSRTTACDGRATRIKSVTRADYTPTQVDFEASGGGLDTTPLLQTTVNVSGQGRGCLVVNFSTMALPLDDDVVFQVRVDGVPMEGHLSGFDGFATPVVADPEETDQNRPRMAAYTFFKEVEPGPHRVEVLFAGCCSTSPPAAPLAWAGSSVLAIHYR
jgi:hypothetical protein